MQRLDLAAIATSMAPDLVVHAPKNIVVTRDNVLARLRSGEISYEPDFERNIAFAGVRGDCVVIMGEEIVLPDRDAPSAGKVVRRRFTDVWKHIDRGWSLIVRQATIASVT